MSMQLISPNQHCGGASAGTQAVRAGNLIFVGGQMSLDEQGRVVGSDITAQATNAFDALKRVLAEAGATMADVVKHNVYVSCEGDAAQVRTFMQDLDAVRVKYFTAPGPTTTETRVGLDREGALILVDAWAVVGEHKQKTLMQFAILPVIMAVAYLFLFLYYRSKGGYKVEQLGGGH